MRHHCVRRDEKLPRIRTPLLFAFMLTSCSSLLEKPDQGMNLNYTGYVPARIAVMSCQPWPNGSSYHRKPVSITTPNTLQAACRDFDDFVIGSFKNQPYMRGFSPAAVNKLLVQKEKEELPKELEPLWSKQIGPCPKCPDGLGYYQHQLSSNAPWRAWLNKFSRQVRNADAVLFPFVLYINQQNFSDRGLQVSRRSAEIALLLVDTNNGNLIWGRTRQATVRNQELDPTKSPQKVDPPEWKVLYQRLYLNSLWRDFPGRQTL